MLLASLYYFSAARKTILGDVFVDLLMASSSDKTCDEKLQENRREAEHHQQKGSFLPKFFGAMFNEEEDAVGPNTTYKIKKGDNEPQSEETKHYLEHNEMEANSNCFRQEEQQDEVKKGTEEGYNITTTLGSGKAEDRTDGNVETSISITNRQQVILPVTDDGKLGVDNLGFKYERSEDLEKDHFGCTLGITKPRKSLAFSLPEAPGKTKIDEERARRELRLEKAITTGEEGRRIQVQKQRSTSDVHDLVVSSPIVRRPRAKKRPKTVKGWLSDPNVYKVYYHLSCNYCC